MRLPANGAGARCLAKVLVRGEKGGKLLNER